MILLADKVTKARPGSMLYRFAQAQVDIAYAEINARMKEEESFDLWDYFASEWWSISLIRISLRTRLF